MLIVNPNHGTSALGQRREENAAISPCRLERGLWPYQPESSYYSVRIPIKTGSFYG
jgi:hypothetical protein